MTALVSLLVQPFPGSAQDASGNLSMPRAISPPGASTPQVETRFSALSEITSDNASALKLVFSFRTGNPGGHGAAPKVVGSTLLVLTPFPHTLFAIDLDPTSMGRVKWSYRPRAGGRAEGLATSEAINDGPAVADGRIYLTTLDGRVVALDADTGEVAWEREVADLSKGEILAGSPLAADGRVLVGSSGDDFGARGWIVALDAADGRAAWRRYSTGPDADVGIGPSFRSAYPDAGGADRGLKTWPPSGWRMGGGGVSGPLSVDAAASLLIHGTGKPAPANPERREGENRWTSGLFARDLASGEARWFTPINPHDLFGLGATAPNLLIDRDWRGSPRRLLVHPDANGYLYVLDRDTGAILSAEPFVPVNATNGVDLATGELRRDPSKAARFQVMARDVCPGTPGAVGGAAAYSPDTGLVYLPVSRLCMDYEARNATYIPGTPFMGANIRLKPPRDGSRGALVAWDLAAARPVWTLDEAFPLGAGVLATAGGLVLYGTLDGLFKAVDARSGREVWRYPMTSGIIGQPTTFRAPDGRQYVAVLAGLGGPFGRAARAGIDARDATAAGGAANALRDLPRPSDESGTLYVFRLP